MGTIDRSQVPKMVSGREIADMAGVSPSAASSWARTYEDFPQPFDTLAIGAIYFEEEVAEFLATHDNLGQPTQVKLTKDQKKAIRERMGGGDIRVSVIAREYGVSRALIYKVAGDLLSE